MTIYFIIILLTLIFGYQAQSADISQGVLIDDSGRVHHSRNARTYFIIIAIILICVAGLRYYVGTDYGAYYNGYIKYADTLWESIKTFDEPGYPLISKIAQLIYSDGATAIFLASAITIGLSLFTIYRNTDKLFLALMLFLFFGCWDGSFNGVRQYLAASVLFCGYPFLKNGKFLKYAIFVILAFLFHRSAIVMILPFFVIRRKVNYKNLLVLIVVTIIAYYSTDRLFEAANWVMDSEYSTDVAYTTHAVNILRIFISLAPVVLFVPAWMGKTNKEQDFYINILVIGAALRIMTMSSALLYRIGIYTSLFQVMAIPKLLDIFKDKTRRTIIICMFILYGLAWIYEIWNSSNLNNFTWIWQRK